MKKYLNILFGALSLAVLIMFFVPIVLVEDLSFSAFLLVFCKDFDSFSLIFTLPFGLLIASFILLIFKEKNSNLITISFFMSMIGGILFLFFNSFYEFSVGLDSGTAENSVVVYILAIASFALFLYCNSLVFKTYAFSLRDIVEAAMFVALAIVLDLAIFKIKIVQNGGSISFIMVPLFILALRKGFVKGFISLGIVFCLISCMFDGYGFFTYPFDYLLGFGGLAVIGLFKKLILLENGKFTLKGVIFLLVGSLAGLVVRTLSSTISGMIIYQLSFIDSLVYQLTYIIPSGIISMVGLVALYKPILIVNKLFPEK